MRWNRYHIEIQTSILSVLSRKDPVCGIEAVESARCKLEKFISRNHNFGESHLPVKVPDASPSIIHKMAVAGMIAGTGPMAAVAGTIAEECLKAIISSGIEEAIVDNGGDIALKILQPVLVGIYAGSNLPNNLAFEIEPRKNILGICTSSGRVGHSFSYGRADAAIIFSENLALADATATALGNRIRETADLKTCFDFIEDPEIEGGMAIIDGKIALWGKVPRIVSCAYDPDLITKGRLQAGNCK